MPDTGRVDFGRFVANRRRAGELVVQPRIGFSDPAAMRAGLLATRQADAVTVGTITLDSYTRTGDFGTARAALDSGERLNGFPIVTHGAETTRAVLEGVQDSGFPVQVRHGSANPQRIVTTMLAAGLGATEGGPVSYCLPYGRTPLRHAVRHWSRCCRLLAESDDPAAAPHLETFGGCMLGQLCPPSLLVALSVLEALFFAQHGVPSISVSYAQQTHAGQDEEAVLALHRLAGEFLRVADWHIVLYAYMGVYPKSTPGALLLLDEAARLALRTPAARLIVKTPAEAHRIPTIAENVRALESAARIARQPGRSHHADESAEDTIEIADDTGEIYAEARCLVDAVLAEHDDLGQALLRAFGAGILDIPYCLHPDNRGAARGFLDHDGRLRWSDRGGLPLPRHAVVSGRRTELSSTGLLAALSYVQRRYDAAAVDGARATFLR